MLARSLIPCLSIKTQGPGPAGLDASAWLDRASQLEDDGADAVIVSADGGVAPSLAAALAEALSIPVMVEVGGPELEALLGSGADRAILGADAPGLREAAQKWGRTAIVARVALGQHELAREAVTAGAGGLLVTWPRGVNGPIPGLRALSDSVSVPVIAAGPFAGLEQVRHALHEGRAEAIALPVEVLEQAHGIFEVKRYLAAAGIVVRGMS